MLGGYLKRGLTPDALDGVRTHLDSCTRCWSAWNRFRWDTALGTPLLQELRAFLGPAFRPYLDSSSQLADEWDAASPSDPHEVAEFFRASDAYLYNLSVWEASGHRPPYLQHASAALLRSSPRVVLDYGCGIGSDLIGLHQITADSSAPFTVTGCDYASPSTAFLRDRLRRRDLHVQVVEPDELDALPQPDVLWIIDTLDHLADLDGQLGPLLPGVQLLVCEDLAERRAHGDQRFHHRRHPAELGAVLERHGLHAAPGPPGHAVSYWRRR